MLDSPWNDERDLRLKQLVSRQFSYAQITIMLNHEFHMGITRNSAIGRGMRIGVEKRFKPVNDAVMKKKKPPPKLVVIKPVFKCVPLPSESVSTALHVSLIELADGACKYPFGNVEFTFCGQPVLHGCVYCRSHFALTHQGAESSRHTK